MKMIQIASGGLCAAALLACSPTANQELIPEGGRAHGFGTLDKLTSAEHSAYISDQQYIHSLARPGKRVRFNFADPRQYNFARTRLKLAGKHAGNSPYLFELIEARRQEHINSELKAGTFAPDVGVQSFTDPGRQEMHYIEQYSVAPVDSATAEAAAAASSTFPDGAYYTYLDASITTTGGTPISPFEYTEEYDNPEGFVGANVTLSTRGNLSLSNIRRYVISSSKFEESDHGFTGTYIYTEFGSGNPLSAAALPELSVIQVDAPRADIKAPNNLISICIDRSWTSDCDYIVPITPGQGYQQVKLPLKGNVRLASNHVFDRAKIDDIRDQCSLDPGCRVGELKIVLANVGGGCDVKNGNELYASMKALWNRVFVSPPWAPQDDKTLEWDLTDVHAAFFDAGCTQMQNQVKFTVTIPLYMKSSGFPVQNFESSITITNDDQVARPDHRLPPSTMTNSCLAEGTQIHLGNGKLAPIESLRIGQEVFSPHDLEDHALTITDTAKGSERAPMVRIRDEAGHTLLMTEMHPIATPDRGMVQARALRNGDVVMTRNGPSKLTEVSREPYSGQVYNLKVGSKTELASLGPDQTSMYANGFLVGDGQIQSKYEVLSMKQEYRTTIEQLPERWRRDYMLSARRR
jgi:hypothetical protein